MKHADGWVIPSVTSYRSTHKNTRPIALLTYIYKLTYNLWCPFSVAAMCNPQGMVGMMIVHHIPVHSS